MIAAWESPRYRGGWLVYSPISPLLVGAYGATPPDPITTLGLRDGSDVQAASLTRGTTLGDGTGIRSGPIVPGTTRRSGV